MLWLVFGGFTNVPRLIFLFSWRLVSPWNCLPDAADGKGSLGVSFMFFLSRDCVRTACCSASHFRLSFRRNPSFHQFNK